MQKKTKNSILNIPKNPKFNVPVYFSNDEKKSYIHQLKQHFFSIRNFLQRCKSINFEPVIKKELCERVNNLQTSILSVIQKYLDGYPATAFDMFEKMLIENNMEEEIKSLIQVKISKDSYFFRVQKHYSAIPRKIKDKEGLLDFKTPFDLFHPPFQKRHSVNTNRFSISGYPCLYLSQHLSTSYSECFPAKNEDGSFHVICFKNTRPLYFIDLAKSTLTGEKGSFEGILPLGKRGSTNDVSGILNSLEVYQLIIASHTKIQYKKGNIYFKAEYIIPQLLLQWLKKQGFVIDGIRYSSCTSFGKYQKISEHCNYILPVKQSREKGYCPSLSSLFSSSGVYSYFKEKKGGQINKTLMNISNELKASKFKDLAN